MSEEGLSLQSGQPMSASRRRWRRALLAVSTARAFHPKHQKHYDEKPLGMGRGSVALLLGSKMNIFLLLIPVVYCVKSDAMIFTLACLALLPLAALLGDATEKVGQRRRSP